MYLEQKVQLLESRVKELERVLRVVLTQRSGATDIINSVADHYSFSVSEIIGRRRHIDVIEARHVAIYLIRKTCRQSLYSIGAMFKRDHGTILNAVHRIQDRMDVDPKFKAKIEQWVASFTPNP